MNENKATGTTGHMPSSILNLSTWDAALVLKHDGSFETSLPQVNTDYIPENVVLAAALAYALQNEELCALIRENFERECVKPSNQ